MEVKMTGKQVDILIEDAFTEDSTGIKVLAPYATLYADSGKADLLRKTEGVAMVTDMGSTIYYIYFDKRYDRDWVKSEIEAAILCS
jgi:hypothetical protein